MAKKNKEIIEPKADVVEALSKTEIFFNENKKTIGYIVGAIAVVVALVCAWYFLLYVPKQKEAVNQLFTAEHYFERDSFELALNGDGNSLGFRQIIDKYGKKAGEAAYFDAGVCCLHLGDYDGAISYLKKYSGTDKIMLSKAKCCIGDALVNKGDIKGAVSYFEDAAKTVLSKSDNPVAIDYYLKAGICYEELGQYDKALEAYQTAKVKFTDPLNPMGSEIDKYISRVKASLNK